MIIEPHKLYVGTNVAQHFWNRQEKPTGKVLHVAGLDFTTRTSFFDFADHLLIKPGTYWELTFAVAKPDIILGSDQQGELFTWRYEAPARRMADRQALQMSCAQTHSHIYDPVTEYDHALGVIVVNKANPNKHHHHDERCLVGQNRSSLLDIANL